MGKWITTDLLDMMDGFERNTTIEGRQQDICGDVTGDVILLSNYERYSRYSLNCTILGGGIEKSV